VAVLVFVGDTEKFQPIDLCPVLKAVVDDTLE
jgi:hypothetical protein